MTDPNVGRFVWHDLLTPDTTAALAFYGDVIGWTEKPWENGYTILAGAEGPLGGVVTLPEAARRMGAPPHWTGSVLVADIDATLSHVHSLGGAVHHGPEDVPTVGRVAVIGEPQGSWLSVFQSSGSMAPHDPTRPRAFTWNELVTTDHEAAFRFYGTLFGWTRLRDFDMGAMGSYLIYGSGGVELGGMFTKPRDLPVQPAWLYYVHVADLDTTLERAKARGARVLAGPHAVPGGARVVQLQDPLGAAFALHETAKT